MRTTLLVTAAMLLAAPAPAAELVAPYVNTPWEDVELMLEMAQVGPGDYVIDLGSGDGRIVITAAQRGALGHGVELDRELVALARERARQAEVEGRVAFRHGDVFDARIAEATVVTLYLMPEVNLRLRPKLLAELRPGTRVVSNSFDMGEWIPDRHEPARSSGGIMLWTIPARVDGPWRLASADERFDLEITQRFQDIDVTVSRGGQQLHVLESTLRGTRIALVTGDGYRRYAFSGRVDGDRMSGAVQVHGVDETQVGTWQARRVAVP